LYTSCILRGVFTLFINFFAYKKKCFSTFGAEQHVCVSKWSWIQG
jgi:hypothetical protein